MATRTSISLTDIKRELLVLKNRVSYLERALRRAKDKGTRKTLADRREQAEADTRRKVLKEFLAHNRAELYRRSPPMLVGTQLFEDKMNAFFRAKGLAPEPSEIPKELRKKAKALTAEPRRTDGAI